MLSVGVRWETFCSSIYWYQCGARLSPFSVLVLRKIQALFGVLTSPNHRNLRRETPNFILKWLQTKGSSLIRCMTWNSDYQQILIYTYKPSLAAVSGCTGRRSIPRYAHNIQKYIYIYIHIHAHIQTYIYIYVSKYMLYRKYTYIHNTHCSSTGHASQDSTGAFAETLLCASES